MTTDSPIQHRDVELIDYLNILWGWKWLIVLGTLTCVLVAALVTMLLPRTYRIEMAIETGDLSEESVKEVDRLVARLNAGASPSEGGPAPLGSTLLTAQFRKPLLIEVALDTQFPAKGVETLERMAARVLEDINRLLKAQQEDDAVKADSIRAQMEALKQEARIVMVQLQTDSDRRIRIAKAQIESVRVQRDRLDRDRAQLLARLQSRVGNMLEAARDKAREQGTQLTELRREKDQVGVQLKSRISNKLEEARENAREQDIQLAQLQGEKSLQERQAEQLRRSLEVLQKARAEVLHRVGDPTTALVHNQLSGEIVTKETALIGLERQLALELPMRWQALETKQRLLKAHLAALETVQTALNSRRESDTAQDIDKAREVLYRAVPGDWTITSLEQRLAVELPIRLQELETKHRTSRAQVTALEMTLAALNNRRVFESPQEVENVREIVYRAVPGDPPTDTSFDLIFQKLAREIPEAVKDLDERARTAADQVKAFEAATALLRDSPESERAKVLEKLRETIYRTATPGSSDATFVESAVKRVDAELPEKLRVLGRQADTLTRRATVVRSARLVRTPEIPPAPIRPQVKLNMAAGLVVGFIGSVLLAFFVEYVQRSRSVLSTTRRHDD